ncbi:hypothetical protein ACFWWB_03590 [Streptomyces sp. NPDC058690]|uniref:hypothetical protein n=1 Tax=Streptomyces sp. NPDC058690 TaxID=3346600 RepID=UPI00364FAC44
MHTTPLTEVARTTGIPWCGGRLLQLGRAAEAAVLSAGLPDIMAEDHGDHRPAGS